MFEGGRDRDGGVGVCTSIDIPAIIELSLWSPMSDRLGILSKLLRLRSGLSDLHRVEVH
jgi:hypothetical protein